MYVCMYVGAPNISFDWLELRLVLEASQVRIPALIPPTLTKRFLDFPQPRPGPVLDSILKMPRLLSSKTPPVILS
jgi:hypothetical protein